MMHGQKNIKLFMIVHRQSLKNS